MQEIEMDTTTRLTTTPTRPYYLRKYIIEASQICNFVRKTSVFRYYFVDLPWLKNVSGKWFPYSGTKTSPYIPIQTAEENVSDFGRLIFFTKNPLKYNKIAQQFFFL